MGDLAKLIVAKGFKKLSKVQKIATSGHTAWDFNCAKNISLTNFRSFNDSHLANWLKLVNKVDYVVAFQSLKTILF